LSTAGKVVLEVEGIDNRTAKTCRLSSNAAVANKNPVPNLEKSFGLDIYG
jgi:hypothetical protein